jgi:hypothetical protein
MRRLSLTAVFLLGCSSSAPVAGSGGASGTGGANAGSGGASSGGGGQTGSGGGPTAASGGASGSMGGGSGAGPDAAGDAPAADATGGAASCPLGALFCDDFEKYPSPATDLAPDWLTYAYGGATVQVDASKAFKGAQSLHMTAPVGGRKYADIIKQNPLTKALLPSRHYGRAMVWLTTTPATVHWSINSASGPLASDPNLIAKYDEGGQHGVLEPNYSLRALLGDGLAPLRGGGPENGDPNNIPADCALAAKTETMPLKRWVCWEWMFDADANGLQLWVDGVAQTEVDITNKPIGVCVQGAARVWQAPKQFTKMVIGWEQYTSPSEVAQEAWLDDLVVADQRVGCPAPP